MHMFTLLCLCIWHVASVLTMETLYDWDEPIAQLHSSNFSDTIVDSDTAWVAVFYSTWCGHCQRFAPNYTEFANEVEGWNAVVRVAAMPCSDEDNADICRDYGIVGYPTVKFFPPRCADDDLGEEYTEQQTETPAHLRHATIDHVESVDLEGMPDPPDAWPQLESFQSLTDLRDAFTDQVSYTLAIVEGQESDPYLGKELILELMSTDNIAAGRITNEDDDPLAVEEDGVQSKLPVTNDVGVFLVSSDEELILTTIPAEIAHDVTSCLHHDRGNIIVHAENGPLTVGPETTPRPTEAPTENSEEYPESDDTTEMEEGWRPNVHMQDLESSLYYILYFEVGSKPDLETEHIVALQEFFDILLTYFPAQDHVARFVTQVNDELQQQDPEDHMEGTEFVDLLDKYNGRDGYLPEQVVWIGCEGSEPQYRGFPCSLWTLLHTLTVNAYIENENDPSFEPGDLMFPTRDFIRLFFSCTECVENFMKDAEYMEEELNTPEDTILWLWRKHNSVNYRLKDDITADPEHPKVIIPTPEMCPSCRRDNYTGDEHSKDWSIWNLEDIMYWVMEMYRPEHLVLDEQISRAVSAVVRRRGKREACPPHPEETDWSPCSVTCGAGTRTRRTSHNEDCQLTTETQVCKLRDCGMAEVPDGDECEPTVYTAQPTPVTYQNCTTTMHNQWHYCNRCAGQVCKPAQTVSFEMLFDCGDNEPLTLDVEWIISCSCNTA